MEILRRFGGMAGALMAIAGAGLVYFAPDRTVWGWTVLGAGVVLAAAAAWLNSEDLVNLLKGRPFRHGANAVFYALLVLGIVAAVDLLAARHNRRFDMTGEGIHTLSSQSIKILRGLEQDVTMAAFFSASMQGRQSAVDLLEEYRYHSPRVTVRVIDPFRNPADAKAYGIEQDGTIVVASGSGESRVTSGLSGGITEEQLTNALITATAGEKKSICVVTGHGERRIEDAGPQGIQQAAEALRKENFDVREVRLLEGGAALTGCNSVVVAGPEKPLLAPEVQAIEGFLKDGGGVLIMKEPLAPTGLEAFMASYGLKAGDEIIVDENPIGRLMGSGPETPVVYDYGTHEITKEMEGLATMFPTVAPVETVAPTEPDVTTETLARTSAASWAAIGTVAQGMITLDETTRKPGPLDVGALAVRKGPGPAAPASDPNDAGSGPEAGPEARESRLVVFGDADHATNRALMLGGNRDLFMNTVAWLNARTDLISIRPRNRSFEPLSLTAQQARVLMFYALGFCPLAMAVLGVGVHLRRRRL